MEITTHPLTRNPNAAWNEISKQQRCIKVLIKQPQADAAFNDVRVVCMSDTHAQTARIKFSIPDGDIFIHAGDFSNCGQLKDVVEFNNWIGTLPHKHKIVIAGNHDVSFDDTFTNPFRSGYSSEERSSNERQNMRELLTNCTYLQDEIVEICGLRIYGSPWQPEFCNWAFNLPRGQACLDKWNQIPENIHILITHGPPIGHGDLCRSGARAGCVELLSTVQQRVKPLYHVFGHVHEGYGITSDGRTIFVNASTCNINYTPNNAPIVFDVTLPQNSDLAEEAGLPEEEFLLNANEYSIAKGEEAGLPVQD